MFGHKVSDEIQLKLLELLDAEEMFALTDSSRTYLRGWLPWVDSTATVDETGSFNLR